MKCRTLKLASSRLSQDPKTFKEHAEIAYQGGEIANHARMELEAKTGRPVVSPLNAKDVFRLKDAESEQQ